MVGFVVTSAATTDGVSVQSMLVFSFRVKLSETSVILTHPVAPHVRLDAYFNAFR